MQVETPVHTPVLACTPDVGEPWEGKMYLRFVLYNKKVA